MGRGLEFWNHTCHWKEPYLNPKSRDAFFFYNCFSIYNEIQSDFSDCSFLLHSSLFFCFFFCKKIYSYIFSRLRNAIYPRYLLFGSFQVPYISSVSIKFSKIFPHNSLSPPPSPSKKIWWYFLFQYSL